MRCHDCNYPLWNLATRMCPECGKGFRPSDYVFVPNSVRFHCPDCNQEYYGTTEQGHLNPVEFDCVRCQKHIHMDDMVLSAAEGVTEEQTSRRKIPWQEKERKGIGVGRFFATTMMGLSGPYRMGLAIAEKAEGWRSFRFAFWQWMAHIGLLLSGFLLLMIVLAIFAPRGGGPGPGILSISFIAIGLGYVLVGMVFQLIWVVVAHGIICAGRPDHRPFATTAAAINYSMGPLLCSSVPCFGVYLVLPMGIWWMVAACCALCGAHSISKTRAAFAGITLPTVLVGGGFLIYMIGIAIIVTTQAASPTFGPAFPTAVVAGNSTARFEFSSLLQALNSNAIDNNGTPPKHILSLVDNVRLSTGDFKHPNSETSYDDINFGIFTLGEWNSAGPTEQADMTSELLETLPNDMAAYRVGDFVFCHGGLDLNTARGDVWLLVLSELGMPGEEPSALVPFEVMTRNGSVTTYRTKAQLDLALEVQNLLRQTMGYPELPDPTRVRFDGSVVNSD